MTQLDDILRKIDSTKGAPELKNAQELVKALIAQQLKESKPTDTTKPSEEEVKVLKQQWNKLQTRVLARRARRCLRGRY